MRTVIGVGVDLTQHMPLVAKALCPDGAFHKGRASVAELARHWPPPIELHNGFYPQPPVCVLPLLHGEPPLVGDAAAQHRRAAGLPWPPEAQVPFSHDDQAGIGRVPLCAAWTALLPPPGHEQSPMLIRRADPEFGWCPEGRHLTVRAGQMLALSLRAFLQAAGVVLHSPRIAVVVPDTLDEAGQQIVLDACSEVGLPPENIHLLPRPLAVALHWCNSLNRLGAGVDAHGEEEGSRIGRLRVLTVSMDVWEALSLEIRARWYLNRIWLFPLRDRVALGNARPELDVFGVSLAAALAHQTEVASLRGWWPRLLASSWLHESLQPSSPFFPEQVRCVQAVLNDRLPEPIQRDFQKLARHHPVWRRFGHGGSGLRRLPTDVWPEQERSLGTTGLPLLETLADGAFSDLLRHCGARWLRCADPNFQPPALRVAAVHGAALAAAAIAHGLPCYREKLLPLELCVRGTDNYGDPVLQWKPLIAATTVEAGGVWRSPEPIRGLKIEKGQDRLVLPLRRVVQNRSSFRQVKTELTEPSKREEAVRVNVEVKPGQGFARVCIESVTPGVFSARLDWRTMEECEEPKPPPLAYIPSVSRILPDGEMFAQATPLMRAALSALEDNSPNATECLRELIRLLNKWPLAFKVEQRRGRLVEKDFMLHYGVIGSEGNLDALPEPGLARSLRNLIGKQFGELVEAGRPASRLGKALLRVGGWFYLAMPEQCYSYLRTRIREAAARGPSLRDVELHAIGLAFENVEDLRRFYPLVVQALRNSSAPNHWLRAVRNICRFRNHALSPDAIQDATVADLVAWVYSHIQKQIQNQNFGRILANCLETFPFLLKRRRYDPSFLLPDKEPAAGIVRLLQYLETKHRWRLPRRLQEIPKATINFMRRQATGSDLEALLGLEEDEEQEND